MKNIILLLVLIMMVSNVRSEDKVEKIDMRGMSMSERIKIMSDIRRENRLKTKPISEQSKEFMTEISKGISGLNDAKNKIAGNKYVDEINKEAGRETQGSSFDKLRGAMTAQGGNVQDYKKIGEDSSLNDNVKKEQYLIEYENGTTQKIELLYIRPTISGGFKLMEVIVTN